MKAVGAVRHIRMEFVPLYFNISLLATLIGSYTSCCIPFLFTLNTLCGWNSHYQRSIISLSVAVDWPVALSSSSLCSIPGGRNVDY